MKCATAMLSIVMLINLQPSKASPYDDPSEICAGNDAVTHELQANDQLYQSNLRRLLRCDEIINLEKQELQPSAKGYSQELGSAYYNKGQILLNMALNAMELNIKCATPGYAVVPDTEAEFLDALLNFELALEQQYQSNIDLGFPPEHGTDHKLTFIVIALECMGRYREAIPIIDKLMSITKDVEVQTRWMERRKNLLLLPDKAN